MATAPTANKMGDRLQREFECTVCTGCPKNAMQCKTCQQIICEPCSLQIKDKQNR